MAFDPIQHVLSQQYRIVNGPENLPINVRETKWELAGEVIRIVGLVAGIFTMFSGLPYEGLGIALIGFVLFPMRGIKPPDLVLFPFIGFINTNFLKMR